MSMVLAHLGESKILIGSENHEIFPDGTVVEGQFKCMRVGRFVLGLLGHLDGCNRVRSIVRDCNPETLPDFLKIVIPAVNAQQKICCAVVAGFDEDSKPRVISGGVLWGNRCAFVDMPDGRNARGCVQWPAMHFLHNKPASHAVMLDAFKYLATVNRECGAAARIFEIDDNGVTEVGVASITSF